MKTNKIELTNLFRFLQRWRRGRVTPDHFTVDVVTETTIVGVTPPAHATGVFYVPAINSSEHLIVHSLKTSRHER